MNPVVRAATRTANVINAVKITLIVLNAIGAVALIAVGFASKPTTLESEFFEGGSLEAGGNQFWALFVAQGVVAGILGTLVIFVLFGWFEHMLRTQAELVRIAWTQSPESATY